MIDLHPKMAKVLLRMPISLPKTQLLSDIMMLQPQFHYVPINTVGNPGSGGDFVPEAMPRFIFSEGSSRACVDIFIFNDDLAEMTENFMITASRIVLPDQTIVESIPGVQISPSEATIQILDDDGKLIVAKPHTRELVVKERIVMFLSL